MLNLLTEYKEKLESLTARKSNQSILKEISHGCSLEGLMLKLKLQDFGHLMWRVDSLQKLWCWEGLGTGGEGDNRGWDGWITSLTWCNEFEWTPGVGDDGQGGLACCDSWGRKKSDKTEWLNWTELNWNMKMEVLDFSQDEIHWSNLLITSYLLHHLSIIMISFSSPRIGQRNVSEALAS